MISEFLLREQGHSTNSDSTCFSVVKEKGIEEVNYQFYSADTSCSHHNNGRRSLPEDMIICCCRAPLSVLLMPEAETTIWEQYDALSIAEFLEEVSTYCFEEFGHTWDVAERNLAAYNGHLVALDFGDPEADC